MAEEKPDEQAVATEAAEVTEEQAVAKDSPKQKYPTLVGIKCPDCGSTDFRVLGIKGSSAGVAAAIAFGAVGNLVMDANSKGNFELKPVKYQCTACRKKYESLPVECDEDEVLDEPCTINFTRESSIIGCAVTQQVYLNGVKIDNVKNGKTLTFQTFIKHNVIFVTDQTGTAFPGALKLEAESGGTQNISYKRKFLNVDDSQLLK